jgi:iron complex outermembrane receptor protein
MNGTSHASGRARALVLLAFALTSPPALAQSEPATPLPSATDDELPEIDEIVIVGRRKRGEVERDPTASATVIDAGRFVGEAKGVADLVSTAPGVAVNDYGGLGHFTSVSLRGASADGVLVLVDGIPLESALGGGVDLASIPRQWVERIEIVRGVEGAHYGAGALGGVVNVVTRSRSSGWSGEATAGSFETFGASGEGAFSIAGWSGLVAAAGEASGGGFRYDFDPRPQTAGPLTEARRRNNAVQRGGLLLKLGSSFGTTRVDTLAQLSAGRRDLPGQPYFLTASDWQEDERLLLSARISAPGPWRGVLLASRASLRGDWYSTRVGSTVTDQRGGAALLGGEARLAHPGGQLRVTVEAEGETLRGDGLAEPRTRSTLAIAMSEDVFVGDERLRLSPAVRAERVGEFAGISTKVGGSLRLVGPLALRASGGSTFRAPSFVELYVVNGLRQPNPDLTSEEGWGGDAGLVVDVRALHASVGGFATLYRDLIWYRQASLGRYKPFNFGKALVRGVEAEVATAPIRSALGLAVSGAYTFLDTENLRDEQRNLGKELPYRARHRMFARASVAPGRFGAHVEAHRVGRQFVDPENRADPIPVTVTWNAGAEVRLSRRGDLALHAEVRNLLDDRTLADPLANPLPGRMVLVTLRGGSKPAEVMP